MTVMMKEEKRMDKPAKTYLEVYEEHVLGYKHYKMEKDAQSIKTEKTQHAVK